MDTLDPTLANRYLADQLPEVERREYEALLLSSPEAVSELEATARLKVGLERLRGTGELAQLLIHQPRKIASYIIPLAAGIAALAIGIALWWTTLTGTVAPALLFASQASLAEKSGHSLPVVLTVALYTRRAGNAVPALEKPPSPAAIELRAMPGTSDRSHRYHLTLLRRRDSSFEVVRDIGNLTVAADGFVEVYADAARMTPGRYEVVIKDQIASPGATADTFLFDLLESQKR